MSRLLGLTIATAVMIGTTASAQTTDTVPAAPSAVGRVPSETPATDPVREGRFLTSVPPSLMRVSKVIGIGVIGSDPVRIGTVDDVVFDGTGKAVAVVVGTGGFLGMGEKRVGVPFETVLWATAEGARGVSTSGVVTAGTTGDPVDSVKASESMPGARVGSEALDSQNQAQKGTVNPGSGSAAAMRPGEKPATELVVGPDGRADHAVIHLTKGDLQMAPAFRFREEAGSPGAKGP
jgi:sporulation protein YlmC with PRC-barrel domain